MCVMHTGTRSVVEPGVVVGEVKMKSSWMSDGGVGSTAHRESWR